MQYKNQITEAQTVYMNQQSKILPITAVLSSFFPCHFSFSDMTCLVLARSARTSAATVAETVGVVVNEEPLILAAHEGHHFLRFRKKAASCYQKEIKNII